MTLAIHVTLADIAEAVQAKHRKSSFGCPVARAINRAVRAAGVNEFGGASVGKRQIRLPAMPVITPPIEVDAWWRAFDAGERVEPFGFTLEIATS